MIVVGFLSSWGLFVRPAFAINCTAVRVGDVASGIVTGGVDRLAGVSPSLRACTIARNVFSSGFAHSAGIDPQEEENQIADRALQMINQPPDIVIAQLQRAGIEQNRGFIDDFRNTVTALGIDAGGSREAFDRLITAGLRGELQGSRIGQNIVRTQGLSGDAATQARDRTAQIGRDVGLDEERQSIEQPCSTNSALCSVLQVIQNYIAFLLSLIVNLLGKLVLILVDILIAFASYNGFATAPPVVMGWKIVRDVVNMFFIVVLLVSAFATIIQYETSSFHYSRVLPKLLLMAVLINFSRTLIQLAVDFSQVIMLTFVNAFQQAAGGNLMNGFHLTEILQFAGQQEVSLSDIANAQVAPNAISAAQLILGLMLGIILLTIAVGTLIIFIAYIIARIIGLWMALIFAPVAFFATALPDRMKKGMDSFTGKYWTRLSGLLTGGPIVAFFLWLTLATVQASATSGPLIVAGPPPGSSGALLFISQVGQTQNIASFIIAIAMMLVGLEAAVSAAGEVSKTVGSFAGKVEGFTKGAAMGVMTAPGIAALYGARGALAGARGGLRVGRAAAGAGFQAIDKRADITGQLAGAVRKYVPMADRVAGDKLRDLQLRNRLERKKEVEERTRGYGSMTRDELKFEAKRGGTAPADKEMRAKALEALSSDSSRANYTKKVAEETEQEWLKAKKNKDPHFASMSDEDIKKGAGTHAMRVAEKEAAEHIDEARKIHSDLGNTDKVKELDSMKEKNPELEKDAAKREQLYTKIRNDIDKIKAVSPEGLSSGRNLMGMLPDGAIKTDSSGKVVGVDQAKVDAFKEQNKDNRNLITNVDALVGHIKATPNVWKASLEDAKFQRDNRGNMRMYDVGGERMRSGAEQKALEDIKNEIGSHANKGRRVGMEDFEPPAYIAFTQGIANLPLDEAVREADAGRGDKATKFAIEKFAKEILVDSEAATTDTQRNEKMQAFAKITTEMENPNIGSDVQIRVIAGARNGGDGSKFMANNAEKMSPANKEAIAKTIKIAIARERDILTKQPTARSKEENEVIAFMEDLRKEVKPNTKHVLRNHIYGT